MKITDEQAQEIVEARENGATLTELAKKYEVSTTTINYTLKKRPSPEERKPRGRKPFECNKTQVKQILSRRSKGMSQAVISQETEIPLSAVRRVIAENE